MAQFVQMKQRATMRRLKGFDYSRPYFYMVTVRCLAGMAALSRIVSPGKCELNAITKAFVHVIRGSHERVAGLDPIECFSVMPDHIHLLIKIAGETVLEPFRCSRKWVEGGEEWRKNLNETLKMAFARIGIVSAFSRDAR